MHLARPPTPVRCPSPAMSRACRPLILPLGPSRAPLLSTQQMVADEQLAGWGGQWGVSAGEQVGRLVGWGGSGCRGIARGPQAPVELCCCLCLRRWPQVPPCLYVVSAPPPSLVQASLGWCTPTLGCLHRLVCLYQIKLKSTQIKCYIRSQKLILRHVTRATTTHQLQKNAHKQTS